MSGWKDSDQTGIHKVWDVFWDTSRIEEEVRDKEGRSV